ncbi:hypothetical protein SteCoe_28251 [Stentor coeruleus]|uniref:Protein kinase domain-containing protein n=1 Tax=Stentor coeruleus TaxID=5963 RepID=A0A1R2B8L9_9CILI|nr:hypothetical protein SteCoe_28251 [Stentor coeruleus]
MYKSTTLRFMIAKLSADLSPASQTNTSDSTPSTSVRKKPKTSSFQKAVAKYDIPNEALPESVVTQAIKKVKNQAYIKHKKSNSFSEGLGDTSISQLLSDGKYKKQEINETATSGKILCISKPGSISDDMNYDDDENYYKGFIGDDIANRYKILGALGKGTFGEVFKCLDKKTNTEVAVKIIRNEKTYRESGDQELSLLNELSEISLESQENIVKLLDSFEFRGHLCLVFELLIADLFQIIENNNNCGLPINNVKAIIKQIIQALQVMHSLKMIHCDIKPDNIMLKNKDQNLVKIIDFGSSCKESRRFLEYVQNRNYRAPEIVFDIDYTKAIDIWSLGCITIELLTGKSLFKVENEQELFRSFVNTFGYPEKYFVRKGRRNHIFIDRQGRFKVKSAPNTNSIRNILQGFDLDTINFVESCLKWIPEHRISADQALVHPWISSYIKDEL